MGWVSGSDILRQVLRVVLPEVTNVCKEERRQQVVDKLVDIFEHYDCDTVGELEDEFPEIARIMEERRAEDL